MYIIAFFGVSNVSLDATIQIWDLADDSLVIDGASMTHVGKGIYKYGFSGYNYRKEYSVLCDGGSTLAENERYKFAGNVEPNSAYLGKGGGGMVVQYPGKVINKREEKFKKDLIKLLKEMQEQLRLLTKKDSKADFKKINENIKKRIEEILSYLVGTANDQKNNLKKEIDNLIKKGEVSQKRYIQDVADFTDNIYQLQENTKILPNSLNSKLLAFKKEALSKFSVFGNDLNKLNNKLTELGTQTSKFSNEETDKIKEIKEQISKLQTDIESNSEQLPKFISNQISDIKENITANLTTNSNNIISSQANQTDIIFEKIKPFLENYEKLNDIKAKDISEKIISLDKQMKDFPDLLPPKESFPESMKLITDLIKSQIDDVKYKFNQFKATNEKNMKKIHDMLPKLSQKRDLSYTEEQINKTIKDLQANNTKKMKVLRDNIDELEKKHKEQISKVEKQVKRASEESNLQAQLSIIKEDETDEQD